MSALLIPAIIGASTIAGLATPFLFPTEADKATIELNKKLKSGNFVLVKKNKKTKVPDFSSGITKIVDDVKDRVENNPQLSFALIVIVLAVIGVLILR